MVRHPPFPGVEEGTEFELTAGEPVSVAGADVTTPVGILIPGSDEHEPGTPTWDVVRDDVAVAFALWKAGAVHASGHDAVAHDAAGLVALGEVAADRGASVTLSGGGAVYQGGGAPVVEIVGLVAAASEPPGVESATFLSQESRLNVVAAWPTGSVELGHLLGDPAPGGGRLLVTGAAGAVGGYVAALAPDRGWQVTGLARPHDEAFVRSLGAAFTTHAEPGWDAVADAAVLQERGLALVRDGGVFVGVRPSAVPAAERGVTVAVVETRPDAARLADLLARTAAGELPARVHAVVPLDDVADAHRAVAKGGVRGRHVLAP